VVRIENSKNGSYVKQFKKGVREKFLVGQKVRMARNENISSDRKFNKGRFRDVGVLLDDFGKDSYLILDFYGKIRKMSHRCLKRFIGVESLSGEGML
jgi:hypothetical protein